VNLFLWIREIAAFYIVLTLASTGLAKAVFWQRTVNGIRSERVIAIRLAPVVASGLIVAELGLATLVAIGFQSKAVGILIALLFLAFGAYRLASVARTGLSSCNCTGTTVAFKATRPNVLAALSVSMVQAGLAATWALLPSGTANQFSVLAAAGFVLPLIALLAGYTWRPIRRRHPSSAKREHASPLGAEAPRVAEHA
jgi:hypothetical protein